MKEDEKDLIERWKSLGVARAECEFSCGGDSMNDTETTLYDKEETVIEDDELVKGLENLMYDRVEFYVNSDGHYQGEAGTVSITLGYPDEYDMDDEEYSEQSDVDEDGLPLRLIYIKESQAEYEEMYTGELNIELTEKEAEFITKHISAMMYSSSDGRTDDVFYEFNKDMILHEEDETLLSELGERVKEEAEQFVPPTEDNVDHWSDDYTFTTRSSGDIDDPNDDSLPQVVNNDLKIFVTCRGTVYKDENE